MRNSGRHLIVDRFPDTRILRFTTRNFSVLRMLVSVGVRRPSSSRVMTGDGVQKRAATKSPEVVLSPEFHHDLDSRRWLVSDGLSRRGAALSSSLYR